MLHPTLVQGVRKVTVHFSNNFFLHDNFLHDKKVGVWVAISRRRIVGPIFFMNTINSERYCSDILHAFIGQMTSDKINYSWFKRMVLLPRHLADL